MRSEDSPPISQPIFNKVYLTWHEVNESVIEIHKFLSNTGHKPDAIITLHKGGIIPAGILSYHLQVNDIYTVKFSGSTIVYGKDIVDIADKDIVVIDNLIDSGEKVTLLMQFLRNFSLNNVTIVSLVQKEHSRPLIEPHFAPRKVSKHDWVVFPWESLNF